MNTFSFKHENRNVGLKIKVKMFAFRKLLINLLNDLTLNKLKNNKTWSLSLSSRATHASLSSSHGSHLFHVNASNRHHTLLMLTCRSQSEVKPLSRLALTAYRLQRTSSIQRMRHKEFKPQISPSWFAPPARQRNVCVCTCSYKVG